VWECTRPQHFSLKEKGLLKKFSFLENSNYAHKNLQSRRLQFIYHRFNSPQFSSVHFISVQFSSIYSIPSNPLLDIQGVSGGTVNKLGVGSMDYSE